MDIGINAPLRKKPQADNSLCGWCKHIARHCDEVERKTILTGDNYYCVVTCGDYEEETRTMKALRWTKLKDFLGDDFEIVEYGKYAIVVKNKAGQLLDIRPIVGSDVSDIPYLQIEIEIEGQ